MVILIQFNYIFIFVVAIFATLEVLQIHKKFFKKQDEYEKENFKTNADVNTWSIGVLNRFEHLKIFNLSKWASDIITEKVKKNYYIRTKQSVLSTLITRMKYVPSWICEILFYVIGGIIIINGNLSLGALVASIGLMSNCLNSSTQVTEFIIGISLKLNSYDRLKNYGLLQNKSNEEYTIDSTLTDNVIFSHVNFSYSENSLITNLSMQIPLKGIFLIKGKNGSGKSSLINLLTGLNQPIDGEILVDGINTREFNLNIHTELFSVVFQNGLILNKSIVDNICFYNLQDQQKLETLNAEIFGQSETLYNREHLNAQGDNISGGEKKRVLLARAFYKESKIIIFDEVDTNLDKEGMKDFIKLLQKHSHNKLMVVISHNFESLMNSNTISHLLDFDEPVLSLKDVLNV